MCVVINSVGGFVDAMCGVKVHDRGERDPTDFPSCPYSPL